MSYHESKLAGLPPGVHDTDPPQPQHSEAEEGRWRKGTWDYMRLNFEVSIMNLIDEAMIDAGVPEEERETVKGEMWEKVLRGEI